MMGNGENQGETDSKNNTRLRRKGAPDVVLKGVRRLYVIRCARGPSEGTPAGLKEGARAPGPRCCGWGEQVTAYAHLEALQVNKAMAV
ncbi:hypothetical protein KOW79_020320 [Hemibagrus wyckioides]|uniref:Uncharacterized protein n=1 Tax=Hemibagrus wyckioides TaxID=337641 RepID=A0A9D3N6E3_9TELE|nr:hypothetical protein KOW79_020320 [Hemibagrus wyckioides]